MVRRDFRVFGGPSTDLPSSSFFHALWTRIAGRPLRRRRSRGWSAVASPHLHPVSAMASPRSLASSARHSCSQAHSSRSRKIISSSSSAPSSRGRRVLAHGLAARSEGSASTAAWRIEESKPCSLWTVFGLYFVRGFRSAGSRGAGRPASRSLTQSCTISRRMLPSPSSTE